MISVGEQRTALYRFYDADETLLYIGITNDPWRRWRDHVQEKPWYPRVKHQAITWYDSEWEARDAETRAIRAEGPLFNIAGAIRPPEARPPLRRPDLVISACAYWVSAPGVFSMLALVAGMNTRTVGGLCVQILGWAGAVTFFSLPVPVLALLLTAGSSCVYRAGCWLDRNFGDEARERGTTAREARQVAHIPLVRWAIAPTSTFRIWRTMATTGPRDYMQALEVEMDRWEAAALARDLRR